MAARCSDSARLSDSLGDILLRRRSDSTSLRNSGSFVDSAAWNSDRTSFVNSAPGGGDSNSLIDSATGTNDGDGGSLGNSAGALIDRNHVDFGDGNNLLIFLPRGDGTRLGLGGSARSAHRGRSRSRPVWDWSNGGRRCTSRDWSR